MLSWLRKRFGRESPKPEPAPSKSQGSGSNRSGSAAARTSETDAAPKDWSVKLYIAAHHHFYRSLIPVQVSTPVDPEHPDIEPPTIQTGIDIEGLDPALAELAKAASEELQNVEETFSHLPRQPSMLPRMRSLIRDPTSDTSDMVDLINEDPGFVARLLDLANSPYFRITQHPIADLHTAIVHLGIEGLQSLINQAVFQPILAPSATRIKGLSDRLYAHALTCADVGQHYARTDGYPPPLVHPVGLLQALGDITVLTYLTRRFTLDDDELGRIFRAVAPRYALEITVAAVSQWQLDDELIEAIDALAHPREDLTGFARFCARMRAAAMLAALGFDETVLAKAH